MLNIPLKNNRLDEAFAKFLDGKSVAILGHGPSLRVCNGAEIEKYDVIVRIHGAILPGFGPVPNPEWHDKVGKRTDIYYHNFADVNAAIKAIDAFKKANGKFWCCENPFTVMGNTRFGKVIDTLIEYRYPSLELYYETYRLVGSNPVPGTLVLTDIMRHKVSDVFIGGMTCWLEDMTSPGRQDNAHNSWQDFKWMYELWRDNDKLKVDKTLEALFVQYRDNVRNDEMAVQKYGRKESPQ